MRAVLGGFLEVLVPRSCGTHSSSSRSFYDGFVRFSEGPWHKDIGHCLLQLLLRRSRGNPRDMLSGPLHDLVQVIVGKWEALEKALVKSSRSLGVLT